MRYYENDRLRIPKKYRKMSLEQLDKNCKAFEKTASVISQIVPSTKKKNMKVSVKFNF